MNDNHEPTLTDHDYDGIREYDNPLPMWWLATFLGAIIFSYIYYLHYTSGSGPTLLQEFLAEMAEVEQIQQRSKSKGPSGGDLQKAAAAGAGETMGREVFKLRCAACHGPELQGSIGPNLADEYWIHGQGKLEEIGDVVRNGVVDKGMPAWKSLLSEDELDSVAVFVAAAKGTQPANPKAPQGNKIGH